MKKVFGLLMVAAAIVSCSKDDDKGSSVDMSKLTAGKWYYSSSKYTVSGVEHSEAYEHLCSTSKDYMQFVSGTLNDVEYDTDCTSSTYSDPYTVNGTTITIDGESAKVTELSSSKLVVESSYTESGVTVKSISTFTAN